MTWLDAYVARRFAIKAVQIVLVVGVGQQLNHVTCPSLVLLFQEVGQLAQVVLVAQGVLARQGFVGYPAVMLPKTPLNCCSRARDSNA